MNNYDYPLGADTPKAPWNEPLPQAYKYECDVCVTMRRTVEITDELKEAEYVDFGTNYKEQCFTISELLRELEAYVDEDLKNTCEHSSKVKYLNKLKKACTGWEEVELNVEPQ